MSKKTSKKERLLQYSNTVSSLRLAQICMNDELARDAVQKLISLHRKFEHEDDPL